MYPMTATGHALIGALIAGKVQDPIIANSLSLASHFAGDLLPHWDAGTNWRKKSRQRLFVESVIDVLVGFAASYFLYVYILGGKDIVLMVTCIIFAQLPDWITAPSFVLGMKIPVAKTMERIQSSMNTRLDKPWGIVTQAVAIIVLYFILYRPF